MWQYERNRAHDQCSKNIGGYDDASSICPICQSASKKTEQALSHCGSDERDSECSRRSCQLQNPQSDCDKENVVADEAYQFTRPEQGKRRPRKKLDPTRDRSKFVRLGVSEGDS